MNVQEMQKKNKEQLEELQAIRDAAKGADRIAAQKKIDDFFLKDPVKPKQKKEKTKRIRSEEDLYW
jgi:hypothetical protein